MKKALVTSCIALLMSGSANAGTIFSQSLTGAGLLSDGNVTTYESPVLNGSRLDYTSRSVSQGALLRWDILGASSYNDLTVNVQVNHDVLNAGDNDLYFALSDGVNFVAASRVDNGGGGIFLYDGAVNATPTPTPAFDGFINALSSLGPANPPVDFSVLLPSGGADATLLSASEGAATSGSFAYDRGLNTNNGLQLYLFGDGISEDYGINSITVSVDEADVSEPGALAVFGLGLFALGYIRRRRSV
ncbi:MAG: hypothetical protein CMM52_11030 [Rhodospirillaceae bacterium]|nr:hypothetical protein [Rhodospirillaceae bacterium]|tara:strand:- start:14101 stop:14838 length:738 start_codon:yes stop_codon:yes gene_type:complete